MWLAVGATAVLLLWPAPASASRGGRRSGSSLSIQTQDSPDLIAARLASIESDWSWQAAVFLQCTEQGGDAAAGCSKLAASFRHTCSDVAVALAQRGSTDQHGLAAFMERICAQSALDGWRRQRCRDLSLAIISMVPGEHPSEGSGPAPDAATPGARTACAALWPRLVTEAATAKRSATNAAAGASPAALATEERRSKPLQRKATTQPAEAVARPQADRSSVHQDADDSSSVEEVDAQEDTEGSQGEEEDADTDSTGDAESNGG